MVEIQNPPDLSVSILYGGDRVKTPFVDNLFKIRKDPISGEPLGEIFEMRQASRMFLEVTNINYLTADELLRHLNIYKLMGVKRVNLHGGHSIQMGRSFVEVLDMINSYFPIRVCKIGMKPVLFDKLLTKVEGFEVDLKFAPKTTYTDSEVEFYQRRLNTTKPMIEYVMDLERVISLVDGRGSTYYTSSTIGELDPQDQSVVRRYLKGRKSPFIEKPIYA